MHANSVDELDRAVVHGTDVGAAELGQTRQQAELFGDNGAALALEGGVVAQVEP